MASLPSIMNSPKQKNSSSIDAVLGNEDLITEILLRVPAKAVLKFKLVSKKWLSVISPASFAIRHTHLSPHTTSALLLKVLFSFKPPPVHKHVSLEGKSFVSYDSLNFDLPINPGSTYVSQSCNGLLLCSKFRWHFGERANPTDYIFNPTTRQFAMIPPPPDDGKYFSRIRLVFHPSESPRYKVVCTQLFKSELKIYVYSSETKDWKLSLSRQNFDSLSVNFANGVLWNGAVHWISPMGNGFSFSLDNECLETIPRPSFPENWQNHNFRYFGESGGHLHFIGILAGKQNPDDLNMGIFSPDMSHDQSTDQSIVVYAMERGCPKWFVKYCLHTNAIVMARPETTADEDSTASPFLAEKGSVDLLSFIEGNDEEGPLLVMRIPGEIIAYSFKDKKFKNILSFLPLEHTTCYALQYNETLSCV
ncbi:unnamed protein product [Dovyalis caffra]|uniref:F-box domain-containing protein n=1 Tax=Dovyalis caffra TaxID=77055 RepID=A0AAV1RSZ9_9ROSI|nr:unnamed protein product [Dovyalis caffra]